MGLGNVDNTQLSGQVDPDHIIGKFAALWRREKMNVIVGKSLGLPNVSYVPYSGHHGSRTEVRAYIGK